MSYSYMLRFGVQPGFHENEKLEQLVAYCKSGKIDDVIFFINQEELNQGHLSIEETEPWLNVIKKGKSMIDNIGVTTSINPWPSLMHGDRGRTLHQGQNWTLMVDPAGNTSTATLCPLDEEFRKYIVDIFAYYATIEPSILWVEDDFRLHNHAPLQWGGCFCDLHMEEYSRKAGRRLLREEFVEGLLQPGEPHPFRKIWLDTARDTMVGLAQEIGSAVHAVSPSTKVGLMSSDPEVHCAEGRDWAGILGGLAGQSNTPVNRPHLPAYSDPPSQYYHWMYSAVSRLTQAFAPEITELYPELENFPHSRFSKSLTFTRFEMDSSLSLAPKGITLNIEGMIGNGIMVNEHYDKVLADSKEFLSAVTELGLSLANEVGVEVLVNRRSSYTLQTTKGTSMQELYPKETFWASLLSIYGIANRYRVDRIPKGRVVAVSGQYLRNLSEADVRRLFNDNFVLLEGEAAFTLLDMGFGDLAGIQSITLYAMENGVQSYEQVSDGNRYAGISEARMTAQVGAGTFVGVTYNATVETKTVAKDQFGNEVAPGMTVVDGRCFVMPYGWVDDFGGQFRNPIRQAIIQEVLISYTSSPSVFCVKNDPFIGINVYKMDDKTILLITNFSLDSQDTVRIYAPDVCTEGAQELSRKLGRVDAELARDGDDIVLLSGLPALEARVLIFRE